MYLVLERSLEPDPERLQLALKLEQMIVRKRGYDLHVNLHEDENHVVHILEWTDRLSGHGNYALACREDRSVTVGGHVPVCRRLVTCLRCLVKY